MDEIEKIKGTLCWSCAKATGGCSWSEYGECQPVKGWTAKATLIKTSNTDGTPSYMVYNCPEYVADSKNGGQERLDHI